MILRPLTLLLLTCLSLQAASNHYIRPAASGANNGTDWSNAYTTWPSTMTRGDTYYLAGGTISTTKAFSDATSGTNLITIKRATVADHGTSTGWDNSYDAQPSIKGISFNTDYWVFDGVTGGGPTAWETTMAWTNNMGIAIGQATANPITIRASHITISRIVIMGGGPDSSPSLHNDMVSVPTGTGSLTDITVSRCYLGHAGRCLLFCNRNATTACVFEYNFGDDFQSESTEHAQIASMGEPTGAGGWTFRWNLFTHVEGTGGLTCSSSNYVVHGNVFYCTGTGPGTGMVGTWGDNTLTAMSVYNNTFIHNPTKAFGTLLADDTGDIRNNVIVNQSAGYAPNWGSFTHSYNAFFDATSAPSVETGIQTGTGDPFANAPGWDFTPLLSTTFNEGDLSVPIAYRTDMFGNVNTGRGAIAFPSCTYSIDSSSAIANTAGTITSGSGTVAITAGDGCAWTSVANDAWLTVTSGSSGSGNGTTTFTVAANTGIPRVGTLTIAGYTFTVTQAGSIVAPVTQQGHVVTRGYTRINR